MRSVNRLRAALDLNDLLVAGLLAGLASMPCANARAEPVGEGPSTIIANVTIADGSGAVPRPGSVRIEGDRIVSVGAIESREGDTVVDGTGLVLSPGFIDTHSHADDQILDLPEAVAAVSQGITTVVVGVDGGSQQPLVDFYAKLEASPPAINLASWAGHNTYRALVMGEDFRRPANESEIERMRELLRLDMAAGALGLSTGLEYDPGIYSSTEEVIALAGEAAALGGRYSSHIRSEDRAFWEAIEEILRIGSEAAIPVNITHIKLAMQSSHGQAGRLIARLEEARAAGIEVTADLYPYTYWQSTLEVLFPARDFSDPVAARFAVTEVSTPEGLLIPEFEPDPGLEGKTLAEIASLRRSDAATTLMDLIRQAREHKAATGDDGEVESVIGVSMAEPDIERLMRWPQVNICTDGELRGSHPRGFGSFPRVLGPYVRERGVLSLGEAIHKMTARAAASVGIEERGLIRQGMVADLVLFDPRSVADRATLEDPHAVATGIERVWVNGEEVWRDAAATGRRPGRVLRRGSSEDGRANP